MYWLHLATKNEERLISKKMKAQKIIAVKGDWVNDVTKDTKRKMT